jgi:transcription elongation GreA/GreB family factor
MAVRYFLQSDLEDLDEMISEVQEQIRRVKHDAQEGTEQSSESWHDNYVFEEAQRQLKMLLNHLGGLSNARENAEVIRPDESSSVVAVGKRVKLRMNGSEDEIYIGSYMVGKRLRELEYVSYEAPLAAGLLGASVSEKRTVEIGGKFVEIVILEVGN